MTINTLFLKSFFLLFTASLLTPLCVCAEQDTPGQQEQRAPLTEKKLQAFSASIQDLLSLEDEPPTDGTTVIAVTAALQCNILNLLTLNQGLEDYFHLYTAKVGSYIDDKFRTENIYDPITGKIAFVKYKHHYVVRPGCGDKVIGYLKCLDKEETLKTVAQVAGQYGADQYYFHNDVSGTNKYLLINLQYGFLSQEEIDHSNLVYNANAKNNDDELYGIHYDLLHQKKRKTAEYVWIKEESHHGTVDENPTQRNIFSLALWVDLATKEKESDYNYVSIDSDSNAWGFYDGYSDSPVSEGTAVNENK